MKYDDLGVGSFEESDAAPDGKFSTLLNKLSASISTALRANTLRKKELVYSIRDFKEGVGNGGDDTAAIQGTINEAKRYGGSVLVPPGVFRGNDIVVPSYVIIESPGGHGRFGTPAASGNRSAASIQRNDGDNTGRPIVTVTGTGGGLRHVNIKGAGGNGVPLPGSGLVMQGFEDVLEDVRIEFCAGKGLDVQRANNGKYRNIHVDNCGTAELPAVDIWSRDKAAIGAVANETNHFEVYNLRIERPANVGMDIAWGSTAEHWAEWIKFFALHMESSYLDTPNNQEHLLRIGNVRSVELFAPTVYFGAGGGIHHNQLIQRPSGMNGGIRLHGGTLLGPDPAGGKVAPVAVTLTNGNDFSMDSTRVNRVGTQVISASPQYGKYRYPGVHVDNGVRVTPPPAVSATANGAQTASVLPGSDDSRGRIFFGTSAAPAKGILLEITRYHADARDHLITLAPKNDATAALQLYATQSADRSKWNVRSANAPQASLPAGGYQFEYALTPLG